MTAEAEFREEIAGSALQAIIWPEITAKAGLAEVGADVDENEAALMRIAEKSGRIEATREVRRRYRRARGVDTDRREREKTIDARRAEVLAELDRAFGPS